MTPAGSDRTAADTDRRLAEIDASITLAEQNQIPTAGGDLHALIAIAKALRIIAANS